MLWSAVAYLQAQQPDVVMLVYSGDYPAASKEDILTKVKVSSTSSTGAAANEDVGQIFDQPFLVSHCAYTTTISANHR